MISYNNRTLFKHLNVNGEITAGYDEGEKEEVMVRVVKVVSVSCHLFLLRYYPDDEFYLIVVTFVVKTKLILILKLSNFSAKT